MADLIYSSNAAERLFSTFELVEAILINTCEATCRDKEFRAKAQAKIICQVSISDPSEFHKLERDKNFELHDMEKANRRAHAQEIRELSCLQAVNTTFRSVILRSKKLHQYVFREADVTPVLKAEYDVRHQDCELARHINPIAFELQKFLSIEACDFAIITYIDKTGEEEKEGRILSTTVIMKEPFEEPSKAASWRSMLFTKQPMWFETYLDLEMRKSEAMEYNTVNTELKEGATLGDFVGEVMKAIKATQAELDMDKASWEVLCK